MKSMIFTPCPEDKFPDIDHMKFFETADGRFYLDATRYLQMTGGGESLSLAEFREAFRFWETALREKYAIPEDEVVVTDQTTGHELLDECFALLLAAYANKWFGPYMLERIEEMLVCGVTVSDPMLALAYKTRFGESA